MDEKEEKTEKNPRMDQKIDLNRTYESVKKVDFADLSSSLHRFLVQSHLLVIKSVILKNNIRKTRTHVLHLRPDIILNDHSERVNDHASAFELEFGLMMSWLENTTRSRCPEENTIRTRGRSCHWTSKWRRLMIRKNCRRSAGAADMERIDEEKKDETRDLDKSDPTTIKSDRNLDTFFFSYHDMWEIA